MKNAFTSKAVVFFNTRKEARVYAIAAGKNTSAVIDAGTDKAVGARWGVLEAVSVPATVVAPVKTLSLKSRSEATLKGSRWSNGRDENREVKVITKRSFARV